MEKQSRRRSFHLQVSGGAVSVSSMQAVRARDAEFPASHTEYSWRYVQAKWPTVCSLHVSSKGNSRNVPTATAAATSSQPQAVTGDSRAVQSVPVSGMDRPDKLVAFLSQTKELKLFRGLVDTHTHVHFEGLDATVAALAEHVRRNNVPTADGRVLTPVVRTLVVMSTFSSFCFAGEAQTAGTVATAAAAAAQEGKYRPPQDDWVTVAQLATRFPHVVVPAFGIHPWYAGAAATALETGAMDARNVVRENLDSGNCGEGADGVDRGTCRRQNWVQELLRLLRTFPTAVVGEVGLDKLKGGCSAWPLAGHESRSEAQRRLLAQSCVLNAQLHVAAKVGGRAISIHCVQASGHLLDLLRDFPDSVEVFDGENATHSGGASNRGSSADAKMMQSPVSSVVLRIALHSFSGSSDFVKSLLALERKRRKKAKKWKPRRLQGQHMNTHAGKSQRTCSGGVGSDTTPSTGEVGQSSFSDQHEHGDRLAEGCRSQKKRLVEFEFYFGFSMAVNCSCCSTLLAEDPHEQQHGKKTKRQVKLENAIAAVPLDRVLLETDRGAYGAMIESDLSNLCRVSHVLGV